MKKLFLTLILLVVPTFAFAQATAPENALWALPATASPGAQIELNAFIYNKEKQDITFTVSFQNSKKEEVAQGTALVPAQTAKAVVATWKQPEKPVTLTAIVTKSLTKQKKDIATLHGEIGTFSVGLPETKKVGGISLPSFNKGKIMAFIGVYLQGLEEWRVKEAAYFAQMRDDAKERTGIMKIRQIVEVPEPDIPGTTVEKVEPVQPPNAFDYAKVIFATSLASLFANKAMFYIAFVIVTLFVLKFILGRFI